ncbi:MAG: hypothetical protein FJ009_22305 [Chloroflexi bacterium]|nr:hypothetical protein [Chloroflexota bacterium]
MVQPPPPEKLPPLEIEPRARGWRDRLAEMTPLEQLLWAVAGLLAIVALIVFVPTLFSPSDNRAAIRQATLTRFAQIAPPTRSPFPTITPSVTPTPSSTPLPTLPPLVIPTPPADGAILTFSPNPDRTGWLGSKEFAPRWRDRNLYSGTAQGQRLVGVLQFDLQALPPGSKISFAALEMTGRNARFAMTTGEWRVELLDAKVSANWDEATYETVQQIPALATIGTPYTPRELAAGQTNRFSFAPDQLKLLERQLDVGLLNLRVRGPTEGSDHFFAWEAGTGVAAPTLYLVAVPSSFAVITVTPTPENVFAAATRVVEQTRQVQQFGTPTPFPRSIATVTPGATSVVVITNTPTPAHIETAWHRSAYATAMAMTTGTFTPLPPNWVTATPPPLLIPVESLTPRPTPTRTPTPRDLVQLALQPIPAQFFNKILFKSGSRDAPLIWSVDPDGRNLALVTDRAIHERATARDAISPDGAFLLYNAPSIDFPDALQIWIQSATRPGVALQRLTWLRTGYAYAPAWAPTGNKFAYVSSETGRDEIWLFDLETKRTQKLTTSPDWYWNQYPSWSPDGKRIAFSSDRGHIGSFTEIWTMNADGTGEIKLGDGTRDAWAPVWIKWKQ